MASAVISSVDVYDAKQSVCIILVDQLLLPSSLSGFNTMMTSVHLDFTFIIQSITCQLISALTSFGSSTHGQLLLSLAHIYGAIRAPILNSVMLCEQQCRKLLLRLTLETQQAISALSQGFQAWAQLCLHRINSVATSVRMFKANYEHFVTQAMTQMGASGQNDP